MRVASAYFCDHRISYCVVGSGPPLVVPKPHRGKRNALYGWVPWLASRYTVFQVEPLGHGWSDRPRDHPTVGIHEQIHTVLDQEGVDRFGVWGYSAGGAMAMVVAQASPRVTAMVCGGWSPTERYSEAALRRMDREQRMPVGQRAAIDWYQRFIWLDELAVMQIPRLVYVGARDGPRVRGPRGIPRTRDALVERGVVVLEFEGLDHDTCMQEPAFSTIVGPTVANWLDGTGAW